MVEVDRSKPPSLASNVGRIASAIDRHLSPGEVAALRRGFHPDGLPVAGLGVAARLLPDEDPAQLARWEPVLASLAHLQGLHAPGRSLGRALADARCSEERVGRLLAARGSALRAQVRSVVHHLASKHVAGDLTELARLILGEGGPSHDPVRRRIAVDYYRGHAAQETKP